MPPSRIVELSSIIHEHKTKVNAYLESKNLPTPSFDASYPGRIPLPSHIQASREAVLDASDELTALMLGPVGFMARYFVRIPLIAQSSSTNADLKSTILG